MSASYVVARRLRDDETHLGEPGEWKLCLDLLTREEAETRTRYFDEVLSARSVAIDLDDLEAVLSRGGVA